MSAFADGVEALPGQMVEQTIAQNGKHSTDAGYATPAHLRYPYVAAYWIRPNWTVSLTAFDRKAKLPSHTVWQEFRVLEKGALDIPAEKTYRMTEADLAAYGIRNDGTWRNCRAENGGMTLCQSSNRFENGTLEDSGYDPRQQPKQVTGEAIGCTLKGNSKFPKGIVVR